MNRFILKYNKYKACLNGNIVSMSVHMYKTCIKEADKDVRETLKCLIKMYIKVYEQLLLRSVNCTSVIKSECLYCTCE